MSNLYCYINKSGNISAPTELPNKFGDVAGGFHLLSIDTLAQYNWFPYLEPIYDHTLYKTGDYYFNESSKTVESQIVVLENVSMTVDQLKLLRYNDIELYCQSQLIAKISNVYNLDSANTDDVVAEQSKIILVRSELRTEIDNADLQSYLFYYSVKDRFDHFYV